MRLSKQLVIIIILGALLLSAVGLAVFFYFKHEKTKQVNKQLVTIYVAKTDIKPFVKIEAKDLKETTMVRKYLLTTPLVKKEIIGKYAKETILKNDTFRKEKLTTTLPKKPEKLISPFKYNGYNLPFKLFTNPNFSLKKGDYIKIVSVYQNKNSDGKNDFVDPFKVQFVAKDIKVLGFLLNGEGVNKTIVEKEITKTVKKKKLKEKINVKVDELILDIEDKVLLQLIDDYNKGKQLWMVQTTYDEKLKQKQKEKTIAKNDIKKTKTSGYPYVIYKPKKSKSLTEFATISYTNENVKHTSSKEIPTKGIDECLKNPKYIVGTSKKIYFREKPSVESKIKRIRSKNIIIPYGSMTSGKIWYKTCDNYYVRFSQVQKISSKEMKEKLKNKHLLVEKPKEAPIKADNKLTKELEGLKTQLKKSEEEKQAILALKMQLEKERKEAKELAKKRELEAKMALEKAKAFEERKKEAEDLAKKRELEVKMALEKAKTFEKRKQEAEELAKKREQEIQKAIEKKEKVEVVQPLLKSQSKADDIYLQIDKAEDENDLKTESNIEVKESIDSKVEEIKTSKESLLKKLAMFQKDNDERIVDDNESKEVSSSTNNNTKKNTLKCSDKYQLKVKTHIANVRRGPSTGHKILQVLRRGDTIGFSKNHSQNWAVTCDGRYISRFEVYAERK